MAKNKVCRCKVCGRVLNNPESIARGMGPQCERRVLGVVRGVALAKAKPKKPREWTQRWLFEDIAH